MRFSRLVRRVMTLPLITLLALAGIFFATPINATAASPNARDCDDNAVIRCGALTIDELKLKFAQNTGNIQAVFSQFGIHSINDFNGMVVGSVTNTNQVLFGTDVIATDAVTAGRQNMPGSTPILNGMFFQRPPSVSFANSPLSAFIKMNGSQFQFAILRSCGNPVNAKSVPVAKPTVVPKVPNFSINKTVSLHGANQFSKSVSAQPGQMVDFKIVVTNTGQTNLTDMTITDDLPMGLTAVSESLNTSNTMITSSSVTNNNSSQTVIASTDEKGNVNFNPVSSNTSTISSTDNSNVDISNLLIDSAHVNVLSPGKSVTINFSATVDEGTDACTTPLINTATAQPQETGSKSSQANVQVCAVVPSAAPVTPTPVQPTPLVNTGTSIMGLLGIFGVVSGGATIWHYLTIGLLRRFGLR